MKLNEYFEKLILGELPYEEYLSLRRQCLRLVRRACRQYKMENILLNTTIRYEVFDNIYTKSLLKMIKQYDKDKGAFSTFFYYKALSAARVETGKLKRRMKFNNTITLNEDYYIGDKHDNSR